MMTIQITTTIAGPSRGLEVHTYLHCAGSLWGVGASSLELGSEQAKNAASV